MTGTMEAAKHEVERKTLEQRHQMSDLERLRHSSAHVLATADLRLWPETKLDIGPPTADGFYYDFELPRALTDEDLPLIEAEMRKLLDEQKFQHSGCVDMICAVEMGRIIGAQYMILSSVSKIGNIHSLDSRLISVATSESYNSARYTTKDGIENLFEYGIRSIAHEISDKAVPKDVIDANKPTIFNFIKKNKNYIGLGAFSLWIIWGLLPPA